MASKIAEFSASVADTASMECVRAQSFPDDYSFQGTIEQKYHQLGDAVPPGLAQAIARSIQESAQ